MRANLPAAVMAAVLAGCSGISYDELACTDDSHCPAGYFCGEQGHCVAGERPVGDGGVAADAGPSVSDAGVAADAGSSFEDAGVAADAGSSSEDAGTPADAGSSSEDAGTPADAGSSVPDAGGPTDAGASSQDAGAPNDGGSPPCSGNEECDLGQFCDVATGCTACSATDALHCGTSASPAGCHVCETATPTCSQGACICTGDQTCGADRYCHEGACAQRFATADATPESLAFDATYTAHVSTAKAVVITNIGNRSLVVSSVTASDQFAVANDDCTSAVAPGASCSIDVTFNPTTAGSKTGTLTVTSNAGIEAAVGLSGTAIQSAPAVQLSRTSVPFGNQHVGTQSAAQAVTLGNIGHAPLTVSIQYAGDFSGTDNCGGSVAEADSCTLSIKFSPSAMGTRNGTVTLSDSATDSPQIVSLSGTGILGTVGLGATSLSFTQAVGETSQAQSLTVTNTGTDTLHVSAAATSLPFAATNACSAALAPNDTCTLSVTFTPTTVGDVTGTLTVSSDGSNPTATVGLSGKGTGAVASLSVPSLAFGPQRVGVASASSLVTLTNTGQLPMSIGSIAVTAGSADFTQTNDCDSSLAFSAFCTVSVVFKPSASGSRSGTLSVSDSAPGSPHTVTLGGSGIIGAATLSTTSLTFSQAVGTTSAAQSVTVTNGGSDTLTVSGVSVTGVAFAATSTCSSPLTVNGACTASVTFTPTAVGAASGKLTIASNGSTPSVIVNLAGTGTCGTDASCGTGNYCASSGSCAACSETDPAHCGTWGSPAGCRVCSTDRTCAEGSCILLREWIAWRVTADSPSQNTYDTDTVTDTATKLVWQRNLDAGTYTQSDAATYCANLTLAGGGWRLPTLIELLSIVDLGVYNPSINRTAFPSTPARSFWSSSVYGYSWGVHFYDGGASYNQDGGYVRCVR